MTNFRLEPWDERGLALERRANTAEMQAFLGGVRTEEAIAAQLGRFREVIDSGSGEMLLIGAGHPIRCNDWRFELR